MVCSKKGIRLPPTDRTGTPFARVGQSHFNVKKKKFNQVTSLQPLPSNLFKPPHHNASFRITLKSYNHLQAFCLFIIIILFLIFQKHCAIQLPTYTVFESQRECKPTDFKQAKEPAWKSINLLTWYEGDHPEYIRQSAVNWFIWGIFQQVIS